MRNAVLIASAIILLITIIPTYIGMARSDLTTPSADWHQALQWIKNNTPQDALIVSWWDYGYWIKYLAEREAYLTPGQNPDRLAEVANNFLSYDDVKWLDGHVYIVLTHLLVYNDKIPLAIWAGTDAQLINFDRAFMTRLYEQEYMDGYEFVYSSNEIKIWGVER